MADWIYWLVAAGILVVFELFTGTFYVLMIAIGLCFGALGAWLGFSGAVQTIIAAAVGVLATGLLHRSRFGRAPQLDPSRDPGVNIDIGQSLQVDEWHAGRARVMYRGAQWDIELAPGAIAQAGSFKIVEVQGNRLIVAAV